MDAQPGYPFPDDVSFRQHIDSRERPVCGGFTAIELTQPHSPGPAFACTHGLAGCGWRIPFSYPNSPNVVVIFEIDHADQLHREHAWRVLGERAASPE